jgi:Brp/Blh family beta-carotene 15,15'-monooxygenase
MYTKIAIIATFFSLWLSGYLQSPNQEYAAFILIFSLGILHGSNDIKLLSKVDTSANTFKLVLYIIVYIAVVLIAGLLFYYIPTIALILFVIFSAFHFGEQHWNNIEGIGINFNRILFLSYGLSVLFLLFVCNPEPTIKIIFELCGIQFNSDWFVWLLAASVICWGLYAGILVYKKKLSLDRLLFEIFLLFVLALVFKTATLIWAFAIYFIYWHSIPSMLEQINFLYNEVSIKSFLKYLKSSFLLWLISISSLFLTFFLLQNEAYLYPLVFAFLGSITFAHSFIISWMFSLKK